MGVLRDFGGWHLLIIAVIALVIAALVVWAVVAIVRAASRAASPGPDYAPGEVASSPSTADELAKLAAMRASGALSEQEYIAAKAKLLGL